MCEVLGLEGDKLGALGIGWVVDNNGFGVSDGFGSGLAMVADAFGDLECVM